MYFNYTLLNPFKDHFRVESTVLRLSLYVLLIAGLFLNDISGALNLLHNILHMAKSRVPMVLQHNLDILELLMIFLLYRRIGLLALLLQLYVHLGQLILKAFYCRILFFDNDVQVSLRLKHLQKVALQFPIAFAFIKLTAFRFI